MEIISKYLEDNKFIQWIFYPTPELELWWSSYRTNNPAEKKNIETARNILLQLRTEEQALSEEERIMMFARILKQVEEKQNKKLNFGFYRELVKYAAIAIVFFAFGALLFYKKNNVNLELSSQEISIPINPNEAQIIRSNGENILLSEDRSHIEYKTDGSIEVNNQKVEPIDNNNSKKLRLNQLIIPYGKTSEIILSDGTHVWLNAGSKLVYPDSFEGKNREVLLVGEAFFDVKTDEDHPFIVQTSDVRIKALGTKFNVSSYNSDKLIEAVLTEGKIILEENNQGILSFSKELVPGQLVYYNKTSKESDIKNVDVDNYILWKDGIYKFESTDLNRITKKLERYYNLNIGYADPMLGSISISGKLDLHETKEEILNRIATVASVTIIKRGENAYAITK